MEKRLGSYILLEQLGAGAMGVVFHARHQTTGTEVALKIIPPGFACNELLVARFQREMAIVQKLMHRNIVRCFETGMDGDQRFFVMELIDGGSIAALLERKGKLSWQETIHYALQICSALQYAHQHGVIHRDIKPVNLLLDRNGVLKLADFGLALDADATTLTAAGRTVGTVNYMAPEQVRGKPPASPQTDLYALGCVMFQMLTGTPPFDAEAPAETLLKQLSHRPPRVSTIVLDCPIWLEKLILKLLEKEPLHRPADARAVAQALRQIQERVASGAAVLNTGSDAVSRSVSSRGARVAGRARDARRRGRRPRTMLFFSLAALGVAAAFWWTSGRTDSQAERRWFESLRHHHPAVRAEAVRAIGELRPDGDRAVPALMAALEDVDAEVRSSALRSLAAYGEQAGEAVPALIRVSKNDDSDAVRAIALQVLEPIRQANGSGGFNLAWLASAGAIVAVLLIFFWTWRRLAPLSVGLLVEDLRSDDVLVRRRAARVLRLIGPGAASAVPALLQALKDGDEGVRQGADAALAKIGLESKNTLPDLIKALRDKDPFVRTRAAVLLGKAGPAAHSALPILVRALKDPIDLVRVEAVQALGRIDVEAKQAIPHLKEAVRDRSYSVRQAATSLLCDLQAKGVKPRAKRP